MYFVNCKPKFFLKLEYWKMELYFFNNKLIEDFIIICNTCVMFVPKAPLYQNTT